MIFNTLTYYFIFLLPAAVLFRVVPSRYRSWVIILSGLGFYIYFSLVYLKPLAYLCVLILIWEALISRLYDKRSRWCILGVLQAVLILGVFKYLNFFTARHTDSSFCVSLRIWNKEAYTIIS